MTDIVVQRGAGSSQGTDIVDALVATDDVARERGRVEIDAASGLQPVQISVVYRPGIRRGQLVEVFEPIGQTLHYGKITTIQHQFSGVELITSLTLSVLDKPLVNQATDDYSLQGANSAPLEIPLGPPPPTYIPGQTGFEFGGAYTPTNDFVFEP